MRRILHFSFNALTVLSLLLCLLTIGLWVRSHRSIDVLRLERRWSDAGVDKYSGWGIVSVKWALILVHDRPENEDRWDWNWTYNGDDPVDGRRLTWRHDFYFMRIEDPRYATYLGPIFSYQDGWKGWPYPTCCYRQAVGAPPSNRIVRPRFPISRMTEPGVIARRA